MYEFQCFFKKEYTVDLELVRSRFRFEFQLLIVWLPLPFSCEIKSADNVRR